MRETRDLTGDPSAMHALAHPLRLALLELLESDGPLTATQAAQRLSELPGNMSWHLRVLARHGFVHESGDAKGRRRPWALTAAAQRFDSDPASADERAAADELLRTVVERSHGQLRAWLAGRWSASPEWRRAAALRDSTLYLTTEETEQLRKQVYALFDEYTDRATDPRRRPPGAQPVKALLTMHPLPLPQ
jgi:DNA-binding transcriptional ArsR family regulator